MERGEKKKGKKKKKQIRSKLKKEWQAKRDAEHQERLRKWEECWQRKFEAQEERDNAECCVAKGLCVKPRTQSNIWINVIKDRSLQEIQMTFKHVPVPKPKPPPLPPLKKQNGVTVQNSERKTVQKADKENGTEKKRKK